jgi:hypothetical protein
MRLILLSHDRSSIRPGKNLQIAMATMICYRCGRCEDKAIGFAPIRVTSGTTKITIHLAFLPLRRIISVPAASTIHAAAAQAIFSRRRRRLEPRTVFPTIILTSQPLWMCAIRFP